MKFDRKTVDFLYALPDEKLGQLASVLAAGKGLTRDGGLGPDAARKLKEVMGRLTDEDISRISELIDIWRDG